MNQQQSNAEQNSKNGEEEESTKEVLARRAAVLAREVTRGVLGSLDSDGYPYTSLADVVFDGDGGFWFLLSDLATHTQNVARDDRVTLLLCEGQNPEEPQTLDLQRGSFRGRISDMDRRREKIEDHYLEHHPEASKYVDFSDFRFYRMQIEKVRMIGGFGEVGWVDAEEMKHR